MLHGDVKRGFWRGFRDGVPFIMVAVPFATMFGVVSVDAGLNVIETLAFSVVVIAGSAQFTALQLMTEQAPTIVVLASALMVNLRMAMYSASITPHLGALPIWKRACVAYMLIDQTYACSSLDYEKNPDQSVHEKLAYFFGVCVPMVPLWYLFTLVGAWVGKAIPAEMGLDFVLPIAFISMIAPALRTGPHRLAALVATVTALCFAGLPYNIGLVVASLAGMMAGAEWERRLTKEATA
jgi:4-azaleucine resistance transporter AzlC